jgi:hypothetical protein
MTCPLEDHLILFLPFATMATSISAETSNTMPAEPMFAGSWKLAEVFDDRMASINLPAGSFDPAAPETLWRSGNYDMSLALGNRLEEELLPLFQHAGWFKPRKAQDLYRTQFLQ